MCDATLRVLLPGRFVPTTMVIMAAKMAAPRKRCKHACRRHLKSLKFLLASPKSPTTFGALSPPKRWRFIFPENIKRENFLRHIESPARGSDCEEHRYRTWPVHRQFVSRWRNLRQD